MKQKSHLHQISVDVENLRFNSFSYTWADNNFHASNQ